MSEQDICRLNFLHSLLFYTTLYYSNNIINSVCMHVHACACMYLCEYIQLLPSGEHAHLETISNSMTCTPQSNQLLMPTAQIRTCTWLRILMCLLYTDINIIILCINLFGSLREKNEHLKKELADKEDLIRTQTAKVGIKACNSTIRSTITCSDAHNLIHANLKMTL